MNLRFTIVALVTITAALPPPVPAQEAPAPPVVINACGPILNNGNTQTLFGVPVASTSSGIQIQFTNESSKTANLINFAVDSNGSSFVIRDVGTFSPGVEIKHRFTNGSGQAFVLPQFVAPNISCHVQSVGFTDGTMWRRGETRFSSPAPQTATPLSVAPQSVDVDRNAESHLFMVMSTAKISAFTETDTCGGIATITLSASGEAAATYVVHPLGPGTCSALIRDQLGHTAVVPITVH